MLSVRKLHHVLPLEQGRRSDSLPSSESNEDRRTRVIITQYFFLLLASQFLTDMIKELRELSTLSTAQPGSAVVLSKPESLPQSKGTLPEFELPSLCPSAVHPFCFWLLQYTPFPVLIPPCRGGQGTRQSTEISLVPAPDFSTHRESRWWPEFPTAHGLCWLLGYQGIF